MAMTFLEFLSERSIEITVSRGSKSDGQPITHYDVALTRDGSNGSFIIIGSPEAEQGLTPEDAARALHIRVNMHENKTALSIDSAAICRETAARLKDLLGAATYQDFINLQNRHGNSTKRKSLFARLIGERSPDYPVTKGARESYASLS
jgi:plasmid maintenance system antidote protein VapI